MRVFGRERIASQPCMKSITLLGVIIVLAGCAQDRFATTGDATRISERHRFVADVTCISAEPRYYRKLRDEFHMLAMSPRVRWTVDFRIDRMIKGNIATTSFRLNDAQDKATPFSVNGFYFQTNGNYRVGFDGITDGEVRGLEILTNSTTMQPTPESGLNSSTLFDSKR